MGLMLMMLVMEMQTLGMVSPYPHPESVFNSSSSLSPLVLINGTLRHRNEF